MGEDSTEGKLTPQRAYELTEQNGLTGREVASMYDVSESWVSQLKTDYKNARDSGREEGVQSVTPTDFSTDELKDALNDKKEDEDEYECWNCDETFDYMEYSQCPQCEAELPWDEVSK